MNISMFKTSLPDNLDTNFFIALEADIRGSNRIGKVYDQEFKDILRSVESKNGRFIKSFEPRGGDGLQASFFSPWEDLTVVSALYFAICLHIRVLNADYNLGEKTKHGIKIAICIGKNEKDAFVQTNRTFENAKDELLGKLESIIMIDEGIFNILDPSIQNLFDSMGKIDVSKSSKEKPNVKSLFTFGIENSEMLKQEIENYILRKPIGILSKGLCPGMNRIHKGNINFLKHLINYAQHKIGILQTYLPHHEEFTNDLRSAVKREVILQLLFLDPYMSDDFRDILKIKKSKKISIMPDPFSPLAYQRGLDLNYEPASEFYVDLIKCKNDLQEALSNTDHSQVCTLYDAIPSMCIHIFDDLMFVSFFLQGMFAIATPTFIFIRGSEYFQRFEKEFNTLWERSKNG